MNDVVKRALQKVDLPSFLDHPELDRVDGSHTDGITVFLFSGGRSLVWDCMCVATFSGVHLSRSALEDGLAANYTEERNAVNRLLLQRHITLSRLQAKLCQCMIVILE